MCSLIDNYDDFTHLRLFTYYLDCVYLSGYSCSLSEPNGGAR